MESIITIIIGIVIIVIGIFNTKGNVSMMHSYHRKRVKPEDILPFGRLVGLGMIIIGVSLISMGVLSYLAVVLQNELLLKIGYVTLIVGFVVGLGINFYAMFKYNKGIF